MQIPLFLLTDWSLIAKVHWSYDTNVAVRSRASKDGAKTKRIKKQLKLK